MTADKCAEVERLLQTTRFWQLAPHEGTNGKDGAEWIIEGMDVEYRVVSRWSPTAGPIRQNGEKMLALSGWEYPADEVY